MPAETFAFPGRTPDRPDRASFGGLAVVDWNDVEVGRLADAERDPRTRAVRVFVVRLNDDARRRAQLRGPDLVIPAGMVASIRRDGIALDRSVEALGRVSRCSA
ncbi:MAG: hypothetical protein LC624_00760 [Halobacteriales archaeon]|nr:hypothetical protein [Halobacteriales archaeon]